MKRFTTIFIILTASFFAAASLAVPAVAQKAEPQPTPVAAPAQLPTDDEIRAIMADRVDVLHKHVGLVVGILTPQGRRIITYGKLNQDDPRPLTGDTVFEIGSVTKIFTALLLADAVQRGEVSLNDPLAKFMPPSVKVPERNGKKITLVDLATQTSSLPFMPPDFPLFDPAGYPKYTEQQIFQFLSTFELPHYIGTKWEYSNLGFGLLGKALSRRAGMDFDSLMRARITGPLGMKSTSVIVTPDMKIRLAAGHDAKLSPAPEWNMPSLSGEGELRSSANDLLTFLGAFMGYSKS
ncbi:MAG TPA: serine hydrolase domain-containing protein, partial [Alphaproteobacteria bacterium]|nr:serine hydrolase domain-containing protein [Alphaproteobacteria bacterium]